MTRKPSISVGINAKDRYAHEIIVKVGPGKTDLFADQLTLHPDWSIKTGVIALALRDVITDQCSARRFTAVNHLLSCAAPRLCSGPMADLLNGEDPVEDNIAVVNDLDGTVLPIKGPPGTSKT